MPCIQTALAITYDYDKGRDNIKFGDFARLRIPGPVRRRQRDIGHNPNLHLSWIRAALYAIDCARPELLNSSPPIQPSSNTRSFPNCVDTLFLQRAFLRRPYGCTTSDLAFDTV